MSFDIQHKIAEIFYKIYMEQKISFEDFVFIRDYIHKISGIYLDYEKEYLIRQRITPIFKDINVESFAEFSRIIKEGRSSRFKESIISAITTNETSFFRDTSPFDLLRFSPVEVSVRLLFGLAGPRPIFKFGRPDGCKERRRHARVDRIGGQVLA